MPSVSVSQRVPRVPDTMHNERVRVPPLKGGHDNIMVRQRIAERVDLRGRTEQEDDMSEKHIADYWLGWDSEDAEHLEEDVWAFKRAVLQGVMDRAKDGHLDAVSWLEERKYLNLKPDNVSE